jgi:hypothetical protein
MRKFCLQLCRAAYFEDHRMDDRRTLGSLSAPSGRGEGGGEVRADRPANRMLLEIFTPHPTPLPVRGEREDRTASPRALRRFDLSHLVRSAH